MESKVTEISELSQVPTTGLVVIDFYATWCGPCKKLSPVFSELSLKYSTVTFLKVDTDNAEELAKHYDVTALPSIVFIKNGDIISLIKGFNPTMLTNELEELIK